MGYQPFIHTHTYVLTIIYLTTLVPNMMLRNILFYFLNQLEAGSYCWICCDSKQLRCYLISDQALKLLPGFLSLARQSGFHKFEICTDENLKCLLSKLSVSVGHHSLR